MGAFALASIAWTRASANGRAFVWGQHTAGLQLRQGSRSAASALAALTAAAGLTGAVAWAGPARAAAAAESDEQPPGDQFVDLPTEKLSCNRNAAAPRTPVVLVSAGSFNPPTYMHLRMCEVAVQELAQRGYDVWGCYLSPVADSYGKQGLAPTHHRVAMCRLATDGSHLIMVDDWEARQPGYTRTLQVLRHVQAELGKLPWWDEATAAGSEAAAPADGASCRDSRGSGDAVVAASSGSSSSSRSSSSSSSSQRGPTAGADATQGGEQQRVRVMLLCGADLLATMAAPGVWMEPAALLREHGVVCVDRDGTELEQLLSGSGGSNVLSENREAIIVVRDPVPNAISSTRVRAELEAGRSAAYLAPDAVLRYARQHELYAGGTGGGSCGGGP